MDIFSQTALNFQQINDIILGKSSNVKQIPNSCLISFGKTQVRALLVRDLESSIIHKDIFEALRVRKEFKTSRASGQEINVLGETDLKFRIGRLVVNHTFLVSDNVRNKCILGTNFLKAYNCDILYDISCLKIKNQIILL